MAGLSCKTCGEEGGVVMFTAIDNGDVEVVGAACLPGFALGLAASMTEGMTVEQCEAYGELFDAIASHDLRKPAQAAGKATRKRTPALTADTAQDADTSGAGDSDGKPEACLPDHSEYDHVDPSEHNPAVTAE